MSVIVESDYLMRIRILDALEELASTQDFDTITVSSICKAADISRPTFYKHFKDKFAVAQWHFDFIAEDKLYETGKTLTWFQANYANSRELEKRKNFYTHIFQYEDDYQSLMSYAQRRRRETLVDALVNYQNVILTEDLYFQIDYLIEGETHLVTEWAKAGMPYSSKVLAQRLDECVPRKLYDALNRPANPSPFVITFQYHDLGISSI